MFVYAATTLAVYTKTPPDRNTPNRKHAQQTCEAGRRARIVRNGGAVSLVRTSLQRGSVLSAADTGETGFLGEFGECDKPNRALLSAVCRKPPLVVNREFVGKE